MKNIFIFAVLFNLMWINGIQFCGFQKGLYVDVKPSVYEFYKPIEDITNNYIQIDVNQ